MPNKSEVSFKEVLCAAENKEEIDTYDLPGLTKALNDKFGSRGLEFKFRRKSPKYGIADVVALWYKGFAWFASTADAIHDFTNDWNASRGDEETWSSFPKT
jgi:hypothetical protein